MRGIAYCTATSAGVRDIASVIGTECFEQGTAAQSQPPAPAPAPDPEPVSLAGDDRPVTDEAEDELVPAVAPPARRAVPITVQVAGQAPGRVTSNVGDLDCDGQNLACTVWFPEGTAVTFTVTAGSGDTFAGWAGGCTGTGRCAFTVTGAVTLTATFNPPAALTYYHLDLLGSVRAVTDAVGDPVIRHDHFPFGESTSSLDGDPRRFAAIPAHNGPCRTSTSAGLISPWLVTSGPRCDDSCGGFPCGANGA